MVPQSKEWWFNSWHGSVFHPKWPKWPKWAKWAKWAKMAKMGQRGQMGQMGQMGQNGQNGQNGFPGPGGPKNAQVPEKKIWAKKIFCSKTRFLALGTHKMCFWTKIFLKKNFEIFYKILQARPRGTPPPLQRGPRLVNDRL